MRKIRAAILEEMGIPRPYKKNRPLKIAEVELDEPKRGEVLVQMKAAGLCHSDLSVINGSRPRPTPMVLGHEAAGVVVEVGEGVNDLHKGDAVVCTFVPSCGQCLPCREGRPALCETAAKTNNEGTMLDGTRRLRRGNEEIHHHLGVSGFAEYAVINQRSLIKVSDSLPYSELALFGCAVMTGVGAVFHTAGVKPGSSVAVVGLGGIGLNALMGAMVAGARTVVAVDLQQEKLAFARELGAQYIFQADDKDIVEKVKEVTHGGVDYAFETAGVTKAMETAYAITKRGGTTVTTGLPDPSHRLAIPHVTLTAEERTIKGSYLGSCVPARDIPRLLDFYKQRKLPVDRLLTRTLSLEEINEGFDLLAEGKVNRLVITMN